MTTKKNIEFALEYWQKLGRLSMPDLINIRILDPLEFADINNCTVQEAYESLGKFDWVITFSDDETYLAIDSALATDEVDEMIYNWLNRLKLI